MNAPRYLLVQRNTQEVIETSSDKIFLVSIRRDEMGLVPFFGMAKKYEHVS